jgi:hypothetical protein
MPVPDWPITANKLILLTLTQHSQGMKFIAITENRKNTTAIANRLKAMGCSIHQVMKITGVITGDSEKIALDALKIKGIRSVEKDRSVKL